MKIILLSSFLASISTARPDHGLGLFSRRLQDAGSCVSAIHRVLLEKEENPGAFELPRCDIERILVLVERIMVRQSACVEFEPETVLATMLHAEDESLDGLTEALKVICAPAKATYDATNTKEFKDMNGETDAWFKDFYDGGTTLNQQVNNDSGTIELNADAKFIQNFYRQTVLQGPVSFPDSLDNFHNCEADSVRAVMCCWVQDRQEDDNGNCEGNPFSKNCRDADPDANTNLCYVDHSNAQSSNHIKGGLTVFPGLSEGETHCHGLAWASDSNDDITRYRGNNLFYVSFYDHLFVRGYVRQAPGASMCGCMPKLPVTTRSDCTQVDVIETFLMMFDMDDGFSAEIANVDVEFNACQTREKDNNLEAYYKFINEESESEGTKIEQYLVGGGNCGAAINAKLEEFGISDM